jgi:5-carboxyvanillate decarboxylase
MISRREVLAGAALATAVTAAEGPLAAAQPFRRIACEEAFILPEIRDALSALAGGVSSMRSGPIAGPFMADLLDLGEGRIAAMQAAGIDMAVLAVAAPGVQMFEPSQALELAALANERLAAAVAQHPAHFAGLATLAPQAAERSAVQFEHAVTRLGLKGGMINSSTLGSYVDDPAQRPLFEAAAAMGVPIYIHPVIPSAAMGAPPVVPGFTVGWSYAVEAGTNALRLIASGIFDALPGLQIVLGHLGETIPFLLDRLDNRYAWEAQVMGLPRLQRRPSDYFLDNFHVTTSGMNTSAQVRFCVERLGADRVLFAADWPFEDQAEAVRGIMGSGLGPGTLRAVCQDNPARVFGL